MDEKQTSSLSERLRKIPAAVKKNPRLILLAVYWVSAIAAFFLCPDGIAISIGEAGADNFVPTIAYVLVGGIFVTGFSLLGGAVRDVTADTEAERGRPSMIRTWIGLIVLMIVHFYFLINSITVF